MKLNQRKAIVKYGIIFAIIPVLMTYGLGHAINLMFSDTLQSIQEMPPDDPDRMYLAVPKYFFPFSILSGLIAIFAWYGILVKKQTIMRGVVAGLLTVFLCYPILGLAIGITNPVSPSGSTFWSGVYSAFTLTFFGNFLTFWITYPLGALCGAILTKRMLKEMPLENSLFD